MWLPALVPKSACGTLRCWRNPTAAHVLEAGFSGASRTTSTVCRLLGQVPPNPAQNGEEKAHTYAKGMPPRLQSVVHRCLEKDPVQRFHSALRLPHSCRNASIGSTFEARYAGR